MWRWEQGPHQQQQKHRQVSAAAAASSYNTWHPPPLMCRAMHNDAACNKSGALTATFSSEQCACATSAWLLLIPCRRALAYLCDDMADVFIIGTAHVHSPLMCLLVCLLQVKHISTKAHEVLSRGCADVQLSSCAVCAVLVVSVATAPLMSHDTPSCLDV